MDQKAFYQQLVDRYVSSTATRQELDLLFHLMEDSEFCAVLEDRMSEQLQERLNTSIERRLTARRNRRYRLIGIAASLLVIVSVSLYFLNNRVVRDRGREQAVTHEAVIKPGMDQAVLRLADGKEILLKDGKNGLLLKEAGMSVYQTEQGVLVYKMTGHPSSSGRKGYQTISTPRGGQYQVILEDGSKLWLNAASSVSFPVYFEKGERRIKVSGEVYCEISKDAKRPFRVDFGDQLVEVLGTHFNINAYAGEGETKTTLMEGSIKLSSRVSKDSRLLVPGEQASMNNESGKVTVRNVDTEAVIAWKDGYFIFKDEPLESIMRKVSRWYNVEVVYKDGIPQKKFGGKISKFDDIQKLLDVLTETGSVRFEIQERRVTVMR